MKTRSVLLSGRLLCGGAQQACCPWRVQTGTLQVPSLVQAKWIRSNGLACHFSLLVHSSRLMPGTSQRCSVACAKSGQAGHQELARARLYHSTKVVAHEARRVKEAVRGNEKNDQGKSDDEANHREALNVTYLGLGKNIILCVGKGVFGVTANSSALIADAIHSLSDMVADLVALATLKVAHLPADKKYPYGHGKFESIGALCVSSMLVAAGGGLAYHSIELLQAIEGAAVPTAAALWISLAAIGLNEALFHITLRAGNRARSQTVIANAWHHRSDALSSVVAMVGIGAAMSGYPIMDPIAAGVVGLMIAKTGGEMVVQSVRELTDANEEDFIEALAETIGTVPGVARIQAVRHRRMGPYHIVDAQIEVQCELSVSAASQVADSARAAVKREMPEVTEMIVHISPAYQDNSSVRGGGRKGLEFHRPHEEIETDVRRVVATIPDVKGVAHVLVHYIGGRIQVRCEIVLDDQLQIRQANSIARHVRKVIERELPDVSHADIHLELEDHCWGQCGQSLGPACAIAAKAEKLNKPKAEEEAAKTSERRAASM
mmetsp:Transcript_14718/g.33797  ORF Transcript_14718/g.33797 Transcript_14718/m.33797 type:complete len:548 (-) Transcript_14718:184-1827(-)